MFLPRISINMVAKPTFLYPELHTIEKKKLLSGILYKVYTYQVLGSLVSIIIMYTTQMTTKKSALILCVCVCGYTTGLAIDMLCFQVLFLVHGVYNTEIHMFVKNHCGR